MHQVQLGATLLRDRAAQYAATVLQHEVHLLRSDGLSGNDEVAFVLAVFVVHDDHKLTFFEVF